MKDTEATAVHFKMPVNTTKNAMQKLGEKGSCKHCS